jgi:hypothetical protein
VQIILKKSARPRESLVELQIFWLVER